MLMKIGLKNFIMVGTFAVLFIVMAKVIVNKYPVPGISTVVNAV